MAAELVQHDDAVLRHPVQPGAELFDHDIVVAFPLLAEARVLATEEIDGLDTLGDALVTGIVVPPGHLDAGMGKHVDQRLLRRGLFMRIARPSKIGEHAGDGGRRRRAAAFRAREIEDVALFEFRIGIARITVQREIHCPRRLAGNDDGDARFCKSGDRRTDLGIRAERRHHHFRFCLRLTEILDRGGDRRDRIDRRQHVLVLAMHDHQRLGIGKEDQPDDCQAADDRDPVPQHLGQEAPVRHAHPDHQKRGQNGKQDHVPDKTGRHQVAGFRRGRLEGIADHVAVDDHAEPVHEPGTRRRGKNQRDRERLDDVFDRKRRDDRDEDQKQRRIKRHVGCRRTTEITARLFPERAVGCENQIKTDDDAERDAADDRPKDRDRPAIE